MGGGDSYRKVERKHRGVGYSVVSSTEDNILSLHLTSTTNDFIDLLEIIINLQLLNLPSFPEIYCLLPTTSTSNTTNMVAYIPSITLPAKVFETPAASILLPVAIGGAVGFGTRPRETQGTYIALKQPPYRPPPQAFGPVWTALYGLMGYAAYRAWNIGMSSFDPSKVEATRRGATVYTVQLALNLIWMPLFFRAERPIEATADIVALTGAVGYLTYTWAKVDKVAAWCLAPYLGWLGYATYLCVGTGYLNNWDFASKEKSMSAKPEHTKFVDEESK